MQADIAAAVDRIYATPGRLVVVAPLGIGKPNRLLNALYARALSDPSRPLHLATALSLAPPTPSAGIERRFLAPFVERQFGADYPRLAYEDDRRRSALPAHVTVEEFYLQSGALLGNAGAQQHYTSLNYTHVARAVASRGVTALVQLVARDPQTGQLSFGSNPDLSLDLLDAIRERGLPKPLFVAEVHPDMPFMGGGARVPDGTFDLIVEPSSAPHALFALPRQPVADAEFAIGFLASTLVRDGGTLQIGIGALSDALTHALVLRHTRNADYRRIVRALWPDVEQSELVCAWGGLAPFEQGLFGASEMVMDGFAHLIDAGVIRRLVVDDQAVMQRLVDGTADAADRALLERDGQWLHGGFFLGSSDLYRWLRECSPAARARIGMNRISQINELYGGHETLERLQRREARFYNTCMMMTALGAAVSDALEDGRVVSGVGGQYNFVAMAHALRESRSVLLLRAVRDGAAGAQSNVVWNYGHTTIPRHLRDVAITEYGIADLRDRNDADCIAAMLSICDARFQPALRERALAARKLDPASDVLRTGNTPQRIRDALAPFKREGLLPDYPLGSDFTPVEQRLVRALGWLRQATATRSGKLRTVWAALRADVGADADAMARMGLEAPRGWREMLEARMVAVALDATRA